jgi:inosine/xanthosine triphosphatase
LIRVLVGSTRHAKVEGTRDALNAVARVDARFLDFTLEPHDLTHVAPRMPMSLGEILDGARLRATALHIPDTLAIGVEGGLHQLPTTAREWSLQTWAAVTDGERWGYGAGPALVLPHHIADRVIAGEELGDVIDALAGLNTRGTRGAWGVLTRDLIGRRDAFRLAVTAALAPFYHQEAFISDSLRS